MAEIQDEDQWLYGDDKGDGTPKPISESPSKENAEAVEKDAPETVETPKDPDVNAPTDTTETAVTDKPIEEPKPTDAVEEEEKENKEDSDSSSDDETTVTIGKIVKQPDIIRPPPPPTHRAAPTSGLKDDDFTSVGKINGVPAYDYNLMELEEKPWRKPGADLSDYFNYGFNEETWFKYCERQKALRTNESGVGLGGLGVNMSKSAASFAFGSSNIPVSIVNENSKYGIKKYNFPPPSHGGMGQNDQNSTDEQFDNGPQINTIQVMTADRRTYSNKVMLQSGYDDMDFGGYGNSNSNYYNTPPPQSAPPPFFSHPPPIHTNSWTPSVPPPGYGGPPPPMPVPPPVNYFIKDIKEEPIDPSDLPPEKLPKEKRRSKERDLERRRSREPRDRESRYRESSRRRTRSPSKVRHRKRSPSRAKSRSKSHSPSHKHKKKKSKKERSERERSKEKVERESSKDTASVKKPY